MEVTIFYSSRKNVYEYKRLMNEANKYKKVKFLEVEKIKLPFKILDDSNVYYFYSTLSLRTDQFFIAKELEKLGKIVINRNLSKVRLFDKTYVYYTLMKHKINIPRFFKIYDSKISKIIDKINFPLVVKHTLMHRGKGVFLIKNEKELERFLEENKDKLGFFIFQEYIAYDKDIRIMFVGEPIGAMQRIPNNDFRANISQGGTGRYIEIDEDLKELSYKISELFDIQIFGLDILIKGSDYYVIDINREMQFRGFERYTNINVAKKIIDYLLSIGT